MKLFLKLAVLLSVMAAASFGPTYRSVDSAKSFTPQAKKVVARIWHGRVKTAKADEYYTYLKAEGIDKIQAIEGNLGARRSCARATVRPLTLL